MKTDLLIGEAAYSGLAGFTLYPTQDGRWQASTTRDRQSWTITIHNDPVAAVQIALRDFVAPAVSAKPNDESDIFG